MKTFSSKSDLVIDLGMNNGDDTAYYLARGFKVVSIEANPQLCEHAKKRFAEAVANGQLSIINAAVSDSESEQVFYVNTLNDHLSSLDAACASREGDPLKPVSVQGLLISSLFSKVGAPFYLKVDVEGADEMVLDQLSTVDIRPQYLSVEDCRFGFRYIEKMANLGYEGFQIVDQSLVPSMNDPFIEWSFATGASGPFGEALRSSWMTGEEVLELYSRVVRTREGVRLAPRTHWWDIHARGSVG